MGYLPGVVLHGYPFGITDRESLQASYGSRCWYQLCRLAPIPHGRSTRALGAGRGDRSS
jgi:hypothetical protein